MKDYYAIENLHFAGHVDGAEKEQYLKDAKILVNTSIHEALPISFLEALSFGTLLVSNRNPEALTEKFGIHVGDVLGDGFDKVDLLSMQLEA
jgi:glycosyltransferase involved in cell wall biosynthesis